MNEDIANFQLPIADLQQSETKLALGNWKLAIFYEHTSP
jgi:hypothetical protein